jgi:hypothetical protein
MKKTRLRRKSLKQGQKKGRCRIRTQRLQKTDFSQALTNNAAIVQDANGLITIIIQIPIQIIADSSNTNDSNDTNHQQ